MSQTLKQVLNLNRAKVPAVDGSRSTLIAGTLPAAANGARVEGFVLPWTKLRTFLSGVVIPITAANDFGGLKILDFQRQNLLMAGMVLNAKGTVTAPNVGTDLTLSLGSAAAAATPLASTAIDYMLAKTGVGAAQAFTCIGHTFDGAAAGTFGATGTIPYFLDGAATTNDLFLNAAAAVTSGTCNVTFTDGYVDVYYLDLDEPIAL